MQGEFSSSQSVTQSGNQAACSLLAPPQSHSLDHHHADRHLCDAAPTPASSVELVPEPEPEPEPDPEPQPERTLPPTHYSQPESRPHGRGGDWAIPGARAIEAF